MSNIKMLIQKHNRINLKTKTTKKTKHFATAEQKTINPLKNKCLVENVIYKATIRSENKTKNYLGSTGGTFKKDGTTMLATLKTTLKTVFLDLETLK